MMEANHSLETELRDEIDALRANVATVIDTDDDGYETISYHNKVWILYTEHTKLMDSLLVPLYAARARIAELKAANRWIPVGERMPDNHVVVLALGVLMQRDLAYYDVDYEKWYWNEHFTTHATVTHWRPLPEPPEAE